MERRGVVYLNMPLGVHAAYMQFNALFIDTKFVLQNIKITVSMLVASL